MQRRGLTSAFPTKRHEKPTTYPLLHGLGDALQALDPLLGHGEGMLGLQLLGRHARPQRLDVAGQVPQQLRRAVQMPLQRADPVGVGQACVAGQECPEASDISMP